MENVADIYPLSPIQLGMLFHSIAADQSGVYVNQYCCQLQGSLDTARFEQAWQQTLARHPVLRTAFLWDGLDEPLQVVRQQVDLPWTSLDWQDQSEGEQAEQLEALLQRDRLQGFDLDQAPLLRLTLITLGSDHHQLLWSSHHLLFDGWSLPLIWQDLLSYYQALANQSIAQLPELTPYRDYIAWQQSQDFAEAEVFWRSQLQGQSEPTPLPFARISQTTVANSTQGYQQQTQQLSTTLTGALQTFAKEHRLTLNSLVQGAWALLLQHYSSSEKITYGTVVSGRPAALPGVEKMVGLFINTLPVCTTAPAEQALIPWLQGRQQQLLDMRDYEATPLTEIQRWSDCPAGRSLFDSIVVFENYPTAAATDVGFTTHNVQYLEQSNYPLALLVLPGDQLELILLHNPQQFEAGAIAHLLSYLEHLLTTFVEQPQILLGDIPRQTATELSQLAPQSYDYPRDRCIHQLIEAQVEKTPDATAVHFAGQGLTYNELNHQANQLAHYLRDQGIGPGESVAVCLGRSLEMIVAILAVLKAGAAYVPLDPAYPAARLSYCLQDTAPKLVLTQQSVQLPTHDIPRLDLDTGAVALTQFPSSNPQPLARPHDLAYIIYTSGSTGQPKGVMVNHQNLVHSTTARLQVYAEPVNRFLLLSSIAFDSSVAGLFWTLCQGGSLVIAPQRIEQDMAQLTQLIAREKITHTLCVPTLYRLLLEMGDPQQLASLRSIIVAGEACPRNLAQQHHVTLPAAQLYNEYGPTEATVWCTTYAVPKDLAAGPVPIGQAIPNVQLRLLDSQLKPVPKGAVGELYIAGAGLSQGYLNQLERTATAFVMVDGDRLYRTGDLARYRADDQLEWLGRSDRQVKIRGYRIELGEIEDALQAQDAVREAVVIASSTVTGSRTDNRDTGQDDIDRLIEQLSALERTQAEALLKTVEEGY